MVRYLRGMEDQTIINGLLQKRKALEAEALGLRDRLADLCSTIDSIDHLLSAWGDPPEKGFNPRSGLVIVFKRNELRKFVLDCLRDADGKAITTTDLAAKFMAMDGRDYTDRRVRSTIIKKIGKTLKALREQGIAESSGSYSNLVWRIVLSGHLAQ